MHASHDIDTPNTGIVLRKTALGLQGELSMKTFNMRRALSAALTGLAPAAITQVSYAAGDVGSQTQIAGPTEASQLALAPAIAEPRQGRPRPTDAALRLPAQVRVATPP